MRLVLMGTGGFVVPAAEALFGTRHEIAAVFTKPAKTVHTRRKEPPNPMRQLAEAHGTPVFDPESINSAEARQQLAEIAADLFVVADYGQILKGKTLELARLGGVNIHGSLLPKYRGAAPINWALYHGDQVTGVTVIHMTPKLDAGPCIAQAELPIEPEATAPEVEEQLSQLGARLVVEAVDRLEAGTAEPLPQDPALVSQAPRLTKQDGAVDWSRPAESIRNQIRAMEPWPRTYTYWFRPEHEPLRLILGPAVTRPAEGSATPGQVVHADHERLVIATGKGQLELTSVQPSGKRMLPVAEFLNGYPVRVGERFGPHE